MQSIWYIKQLNLFEGVPDEELKKVAANMRDERHTSKALLYSPSMTPESYRDQFILVKSGEVSLYHFQNGRKLVFDLVGPDSWFGHVHSDAQQSFSHYAEAAPGTHLCFFSKEEFLALAAKHPEMLLKLTSVLAEKIREYEMKLAHQASDAQQRILRTIEWYRKKNKARRVIERVAGIPPTPKHLTHERIAQLTGLNRVTVSRSLKELAAVNCITYDDSSGDIIVGDC